MIRMDGGIPTVGDGLNIALLKAGPMQARTWAMLILPLRLVLFCGRFRNGWALSATSSSAQNYAAALYRDVTTGASGARFDASVLQQAFLPKE